MTKTPEQRARRAIDANEQFYRFALLAQEHLSVGVLPGRPLCRVGVVVVDRLSADVINPDAFVEYLG